MAEKESPCRLSRFRGCMCGALLGDCLGWEMELLWKPKPYSSVINYVTKVEEKVKNGKREFVHYTDDSCMTFDLGKSLVKNRGFDPDDVIKRFANTYFGSAPQRNYGNNVVNVFKTWKETKYQDPWGAAKYQFYGSGSYGNGSAMRVAPVPLYHHGNKQEIIKLAAVQSKLTHTNPKGVNGAVLQALAINKVMGGEKIEDPVKFCEELLQELKEVDEGEFQIYEEKFADAIKLLKLERPLRIPEVTLEIGTNVTAQQAVPAGIFCFLYTLDDSKVQELKHLNAFMRAVLFAIAVSCDCDTIGSMVGAIAGAYYGYEEIPEELLKSCEKNKKALKLADNLFALNEKMKNDASAESSK